MLISSAYFTIGWNVLISNLLRRDEFPDGSFSELYKQLIKNRSYKELTMKRQPSPSLRHCLHSCFCRLAKKMHGQLFPMR